MSKEIGKMVNLLRKENNMTLKDLSEKTDLSAGFLSQFERGKTTIAVDSLMAIADALGTSIGYLISQDEGSDTDFVQKSYENPLMSQDSQHHINLRLSNKKDSAFLPKMIVLLPDKSENENEDKSSSHSGEEFIYVLEGILTIYMDGTAYDLYPGDSAHYDSSRSHMFRNRTSKLVKLLSVQFPGN